MYFESMGVNLKPEYNITPKSQEVIHNELPDFCGTKCGG